MAERGARARDVLHKGFGGGVAGRMAETKAPAASDDDEDLAAIGFLFDGAAKKDLVTHQVGDMDISVGAISGEPGAVQSGQYIWPAAPVLANWLAAHLGREGEGAGPGGLCVELGAGCGLCGILCARLWHPRGEVVFTDWDPGTLRQVEENVGMQEPGSVRCRWRTELLEWGRPCGHVAAERWADGASLLIGSDLIYDLSVVAPLFASVGALLAADGEFVMCQSFAYDDEIEEAIDRCCRAERLARRVEWDALTSERGTKLQIFSRSRGAA